MGVISKSGQNGKEWHYSGGKRHEAGFSERKNMVGGEDRKSLIVADWGGKQNQMCQMGPGSREPFKRKYLFT